MRILVLGAGGIGGYFGGRLLQASADVSFLVREARADQLRKHGLMLASRLGNFRAPVSVVLAHEVKSPFDLVILTCKVGRKPITYGYSAEREHRFCSNVNT